MRARPRSAAGSDRRPQKRASVTGPALLATGTILLCGCLSPANSDRSSLFVESLEEQRAEVKVHDPFPRKDIAPGVSLRPPDFDTPRSPPRLLREKSETAILRERVGRPLNIVP